jgi:hypothetical protein
MRAIVLLQNLRKTRKWRSPSTGSLSARQARVVGIWPVARRIYEMCRSGSKSNHIVASCTARELRSARHPAVCACTLNAAQYPHSLTSNERSGAALLRPGSLEQYALITRTTLSLCSTQDENGSSARSISDHSNNYIFSCT